MNAKNIKNSTSYASVGLELAVSILFGFLGGKWLDGKLGTHPWLTLVGVLCGLIAGFRFVWRAAQRMNKQAGGDDFKASRTGRNARFALDQQERSDHEQS